MISRWASDHTDMVGEEDGYFGIYVEGMSVDSSGEEREEKVFCVMTAQGCTCAGTTMDPCKVWSRDQYLSHPPLRETILQHSD